MKSPITGNEMSIQKEERTLEFRKEEFTVVFHYYLCKESSEQFTSTALDEINMNQVYNQYRDKHNLPFPEDVMQIRELYDLPAVKMSEILGFGVNSYRNYENGEVPSNANGKLLQLASDPKKFRVLVGLTESLELKDKENLIARIDELIRKRENKADVEVVDYFLDRKMPDEYSGYRAPSLDKVAEMVIFFTEKLQPYKTQLNKVLFYADFLFFKQNCYSISGLRYRAIQMGPVPTYYNSLFEYLARQDFVDSCTEEFPTGAIGEKFTPRKDRKFNKELFSEAELKTMNEVAKRFAGKKTSDIIELSHQERGWLENEKNRDLISYKYAFDLSEI